ncbi:MAG: hypothetical protein RL721_977 [Candidatus Eisenbacteria bacterium]
MRPIRPLVPVSLVVLALLAPLAHAEDVPVPPTPANTAAKPTPPAPGSTEGGLSGLDAMTATVFQEGQSSFSGLALRFRIRDSRLLENVEFLPTVEYWRNSSSLDVPGTSLEAVRRDATLGADARWMFGGEFYRPYLGAGLGVHFLSNEVTVNGVRNTDSLTKGGLTLLAGAAFGTRSRFGNFIEVKGHFVGGYRQIKLNMGVTWNR